MAPRLSSIQVDTVNTFESFEPPRNQGRMRIRQTTTVIYVTYYVFIEPRNTVFENLRGNVYKLVTTNFVRLFVPDFEGSDLPGTM